ncbi:MAG TPA: hypothetical protein VGE40_09210, partial [Bacilli bacterium]
MLWNRRKPLFVSFIIVVLTVLAGCQAIGGLDINKALISNLDVLSSEGKASLSIELMLDDEEAAANETDADDVNLLKLFNKSSLNLFNMKMQDASTLSTDGEFVFNKGKIPFNLSLTSKALVIQFEGADKPVVINLSNSIEDMGATAELQEMQEKLTAQSRALMKSIGTYLINNLPNPGKITLESAVQTIHGEAISLHKIHTEIYGSELVGLLKKLLLSLREDEAGLKEMLSQLYDILMPIIQPLLEDTLGGILGGSTSIEEDTETSSGQDSGIPSEEAETPSKAAAPNLMTNLLKNKTLMVEFLFTTLTTQLDTYLIGFDEMVEEMTEGEGSEGISAYLNEDNYLKVDLYVDSGMVIRKTEA